MKRLIFALTVFPCVVSADQIADLYPVAENVRGHENTEWSVSYAYHLTDANKDLPRVLAPEEFLQKVTLSSKGLVVIVAKED